MGLDIYLLRKVYIGAGCGSRWLKIEGTLDVRKNGKNVPVELNRIWEITECVGYWRKFAPLHQWMLENALSGKNDCLEHVISQEVISKLNADCERLFLLKKIGSHQQKRFFPIFTLKKLIWTSWKNFYLTSYIRIKFC